MADTYQAKIVIDPGIKHVYCIVAEDFAEATRKTEMILERCKTQFLGKPRIISLINTGDKYKGYAGAKQL